MEVKKFRSEGNFAVLKYEKRFFERISPAKLNFTYLNIVYAINIKLKASVWI